MPPRAKTDQPDPADANETVTTDQPQGDTVTLAVGHPYDELVLHDVLDGDGKPLTITSAGIEVSVADEDAVRKAAKDAGVPIRKVR